jgi:hypothetical protein
MGMLRRGFAAALTLSILSVASFVVPATVDAAARVNATLTIPNNRVNANQPFAISFSSTNVSGGARSFLQREFGTAKVWKSVESLYGRNGTVNASEISIGRYLYRVDIISGKSSTKSKAESIYAYGTVPFETVCASLFGQGGCNVETEQVGSTIFTYVVKFSAQTYPNYSQDISAKTTTCRSATLQFAQPNNSGPNDSYLQVIQSASDPENASISPGVIGTFAITLDGGPWILNVSNGNVLSYNTVPVEVNGTMDCYSTTGS